MRIDRTAQKPTPPATPSWDNSGLRNRLEGHDVDDVAVDELHTLARDRQTDGSRGVRRRVRSRGVSAGE